MTSVDSNFNFLCGLPHGAGPPSPVHMRPPEPDPSLLCVDVINGWPICDSQLKQDCFCAILKSMYFLDKLIVIMTVCIAEVYNLFGPMAAVLYYFLVHSRAERS